MRQIFLIISCLLVATAYLSACGVKPKTIDAPVEVEKDTFPRTYPAY